MKKVCDKIKLDFVTGNHGTLPQNVHGIFCDIGTLLKLGRSAAFNFKCSKREKQRVIIFKTIANHVQYLLCSVWNLQGETFVFAMLIFYIKPIA